MSNARLKRQELQALALEMDWKKADDETVTACVNKLNKDFSDGSEPGLIFIRSMDYELSFRLLSLKHPTMSTIYLDCPKSVQHWEKVHEKLRRPTQQLVLMPVALDQQSSLFALIGNDSDAELFVYDEGSGWAYEPNLQGYLMSIVSQTLAA